MLSRAEPSRGGPLSDVELYVPARPEFLHVLRAVAASVAARLDFTFDALDDLRLAVDEAASFLLAEEMNAERLGLRVQAADRSVVSTLWLEVHAEGWPNPERLDGLAWKVISGLSDKAEFLVEGSFPAIRMTKHNTEIAEAR